MRLLLAFLAPIVLAACVATASDLERISAQVASAEQRSLESEKRITEALLKWQFGDGEKTDVAEAVKVALEANREAYAQSTAVVHGAVSASTERGWSALELALGIAASTLGLGVPASVMATNILRDRARVRRKEPVGSEPSPSSKIVEAVAMDMRARTAANVDAGRI
jgi:hypothetical protein